MCRRDAKQCAAHALHGSGRRALAPWHCMHLRISVRRSVPMRAHAQTLVGTFGAAPADVDIPCACAFLQCGGHGLQASMDHATVNSVMCMQQLCESHSDS